MHLIAQPWILITPLGKDHPLTVFRQSYFSCYIHHPDELLISTQQWGPGKDGCFKTMHKFNFKRTYIASVDCHPQRYEQSCQVVDKISQLTFQLLSLLASPSKAMMLAVIYKMMEKEAENKTQAEVFNILTIKTCEIITYFPSSTKYSMPMRMKTPFLIPDTLWQESERRFPRYPGFHGRNKKSSLSLAS